MEYPRIYNILGNLNTTPYQVQILSPTVVHVYKKTSTDIPTNKVEKVFSPELNMYIMRIIKVDLEDDDEFDYAPSYVFDNVEQIFVGTSPFNKMTEFSGGHGPDFDGNTILLYINELNYIYIGDGVITKFTTKNKIVSYSSPVGNNFVAYPYATDDKGMIYLLVEDVVLLTPAKKYDDPYDEYYKKCSIADMNNSCNFSGITAYFVKKTTSDNNSSWRQYHLTYRPFIKRCSTISYRITQNGIKRDITHDELQQIMDDFAKSIEIEPFEGSPA